MSEVILPSTGATSAETEVYSGMTVFALEYDRTTSIIKLTDT